MEFIIRNSPSDQHDVCRSLTKCHTGKYPTLYALNRAYGDGAAAAWIVPELADLAEYCNCKEKMSGRQMEECARVIAENYGWLKTSEVMLFMQRFKAGRYGRFYGSVDPLTITTAILDFLAERANFIRQYEQEREQERTAKFAEQAVSYEEYRRMAAEKTDRQIVDEAFG